MVDDSTGSVSRRSLVSAIGAGSVLVAGCVSIGGDDEGSGTDEIADEITVWSHGTQPPAIESMAEDYEAEHDGVTITVEELGFEENINQFQAAVSSGQGAPDVGVVESRNTPGHIGQGSIRDLSDRIDSDVEDAFVDWKWSSLSDDGGNGQYGLPFDTAPVVTFYNREMYDDLGIGPGDIETYHDFIDVGEQLGDDEYMAAISTNTMEWRWEIYLRQQGGEAYSEDGELMIDTEETVRVAEVMRDLFDAGVVVDLEEFTESWVAAIQENRIATLTSGAWMAGALEDVFPDMTGQWGIHEAPALNEGGHRATNHGGSNWVIPEQVSDAAANRAFDFMTFGLTNEDQVSKLVSEGGLFPSNPAAMDHEYFTEPQEYFGGDTLELLVEKAEEVPHMRFISDHTEVYERMGTWLSRAATGEISPEEMAAEAEADVAERTGRDVA